VTASVGTCSTLGGDLRHGGVGPLSMSTQLVYTVQLPSALTFTAASEVVLAMHALKPMAMRGRGAPCRCRVEWFLPLEKRGRALEHFLERRILHLRAGRLRPAFAQQVLAPELERVQPQLARDHVGVALVGPDSCGMPKPRSAPAGGRFV